MNTSYEKLPLVDLTAPGTMSHQSRTMTDIPKEAITQNMEDARAILKLAGLTINMDSENTIEASEKHMIETQPDNAMTPSSEKITIGTRQKGNRRSHYTRILVSDNKLIFQSACCLPLKIIAASLDGDTVSGRILYNSHSDKNGGKLVYEFTGKGTKMIIDLKRGESSKVQRLFFAI
jgi:hypothetical protein